MLTWIRRRSKSDVTASMPFALFFFFCRLLFWWGPAPGKKRKRRKGASKFIFLCLSFPFAFTRVWLLPGRPQSETRPTPGCPVTRRIFLNFYKNSIDTASDTSAVTYGCRSRLGDFVVSFTNRFQSKERAPCSKSSPPSPVWG